MTTAVTGDSTYLGSLIANLHFWGVIGDGQTPPMINGSFELSGTDGTVSLSAIQGPQGPPGEAANIVKMQYENDFTSPAELPENLTNTDIDIGKAWWIGNVVYMWSGTNWFQKQMGVPGPPGPTPQIDASAELVPSGTLTSLTQPINIKQFGTAQNPSLLFQFDHDSIQGPPGPSGPIRDAIDYDNTVAPNDGDSIIWSATEQKFKPSAFDMLTIPMYSVPEASFQSLAISTGSNAMVCSFAVPPQPFNWRPVVFGVVSASQTSFFDIFASPMNVGCSVTLGDPVSGQLIGRGFGNITNYAFIMPHFSTPGLPHTAVSPTNSIAVVNAYHTGTQGTVYVTLTCDGALLAYQFQQANAQLVILCIPTSDYIPQVGPGQVLAGKGHLSATAIHVPLGS